ncbi:uncharacterized protein [Dysidea avara]|uniref:uncharacterized protein isoform X2 n=1 Tax=Dysidea avara TaxID=196820 RepID=UPI0033240EA4
MGITGLLPFLKGIQKQMNIASFCGKKVAVDAYCWLHRGAYSCPMQLVMGPNEGEKIESLPFLKYCVKRVKMLLDKGVTPIIVFDGSQLPIKSKTEAERRKRRKEYREKGKALLREGKRSDAYECFQKCIDVSPEMAHCFIKACHDMKVECIVAPYEADSQLAYLSMQGIVDLVITEDSDLLVFGCKKVFFKMDEIGGGIVIDSDDFGSMKDGKLTNFTLDEFRQMCILSGCDYLPSVPGIGLSTAHKLMKKYARKVTNVIKVLKFEKGKVVPAQYLEQFQQAELTFKHQLVFDPRSQRQVPLTPLPEGASQEDYDFAGVMVSPRKAVGLARGNINPLTHAVMDTFSPSKVSPAKGPKDGNKRKGPFSVMSTSYRNYSTPIQASLDSFSCSEKSRQNFKPPRRIGGADLSDDTTTLLSYYTKDTPGSSGASTETVTASNEQVTPSDTATKSQVVTVSRFFNGQTSSTSRTPRNPFSCSKLSASQVARKLDMSNNNSDGGEETQTLVTDISLQDDNSISVIEQSPMKQTASAMQDTSSSFTSDPPLCEIAETLSPSSMLCEDSEASNSVMICEADMASTPSQLDDDSSVNTATDNSIPLSEKTYTEESPSAMDAVKTSVQIRLAAYAYKQSERSYLSMINGYSKSSFSDNSNSSSDSLMETNSTLSRKLTISEDDTCPVKRKKLKTSTSTPSTQQGLLVQNTPLTSNEISSSSSSVDFVDLTTYQPIKKVFSDHEKTTNPSQLKKSLSLSGRPKTKVTKPTRLSCSPSQLNLYQFAYIEKKGKTLESSRSTLSVQNSK